MFIPILYEEYFLFEFNVEKKILHLYFENFDQIKLPYKYR